MSSTVLLVDADANLAPLIQRHIQPDQTLTTLATPDEALARIRIERPHLIVVNVDIPKGWSLCTTLKRSYASIPLIVVSHRLGTDVFHNHQKLDTRADAYHQLPSELPNLEISLGYFSSRRVEPPPPPPPAAHLEALLADAERQIVQLRAERDAAASRSQRDLLQMMTTSTAAPTTAPPDSAAAEILQLRERIAALELEQLTSARQADELRAAEDQRRTLERDLEECRAEVVRTRNEVAPQAEALALARAQLAAAEAQRSACEDTRRDAERKLHDLVKVAAAERASALATAEHQHHDSIQTLEQSHAAALERIAELERAAAAQAEALTEAQREREGLDAALETSRRLMREYATTAGQKADHLKELEDTVAQQSAELERAQGQLAAFEQMKSALAEAELNRGERTAELARLEEAQALRTTELTEITAKLATQTAECDELRGRVTALEGERAERDEAHRALVAEHAATAEALQRVESELTETRVQLEQAERDRAESAARLAQEQARGERLEAEADARRQESALAQNELARDLNTTKQELDLFQTELSAKTAELERLTHDLTLQRTATAQHEETQAALRAEVASLTTARDAATARLQAWLAWGEHAERRLVAVETARLQREVHLEAMLAEVRAEAIPMEPLPAKS